MVTKYEFSEVLNELMNNQNIDDKTLANKLNIPITTLRSWLDGSNKISLNHAIVVSDYFQCSLEFLFGKTDTKLDFTIQPVKSFYQSLMDFMTRNKISRYSVVKNSRFSNGHFSSWKSGTEPTLIVVAELAEYFNCTIDQLVGRENLL